MEGIRLTPLIRHTRVYQEIREEVAADMIFRQLKKRFGQELSEEMRAQVESLRLTVLHRLSEDLFDFTYAR